MSATLGVLAGLVLALGTVYLARRWEPATALRVWYHVLACTSSVNCRFVREVGSLATRAGRIAAERALRRHRVARALPSCYAPLEC
jgi:hypothetical protein